jgi:hypothetical protein
MFIFSKAVTLNALTRDVSGICAGCGARRANCRANLAPVDTAILLCSRECRALIGHALARQVAVRPCWASTTIRYVCRTSPRIVCLHWTWQLQPCLKKGAEWAIHTDGTGYTCSGIWEISRGAHLHSRVRAAMKTAGGEHSQLQENTRP